MDSRDQLLLENEGLRIRLAEAFEALNAIRLKEADVLVAAGMNGNGIFSLTSQESPYLDFLEEELGVPVKIVSVGPDRAQTIVRYEE